MRQRRALVLLLVIGTTASVFITGAALAKSSGSSSTTTAGPEWLPLKGRFPNGIGCTWANGCNSPTPGYHGYNNPAIDFIVVKGSPVHAAGDGVVEVAYRDCPESRPCGPNGSGFGNSIAIRHDNGRYSWYAHMSDVFPAEGQRVLTGEQIGTSGTTGNSTRPHLHYEERPTLWAAPIIPGSMWAYHKARKVRYPEALGKTSWQSVPCGQQPGQPGCRARPLLWNDGYTVKEATDRKGACQPRPLGVVFVLDDSGSNIQRPNPTDPHLLRADAARVALGYLPAGTLVSAIKFANSASTIVQPTRLTSGNWQSIASQIRSNLQSSGGTNYEAGFVEAINHLGRMQGVQRIVIFLSDGKPTSPYSSHQRIAQQRTQIHTVGYGPVRNLPVLIDIARRSGASYQPINNVAEASNAFATIIHPYQCNKPIDEDTHTLRPNRTWKHHFVVGKNVRGITAIATWTQQAKPKLDLIRPDGTKLSDGLYQGEGRQQQGRQVVRMDVTKPYQGTWTLVAVSPGYVNLAFNAWKTQENPIALRPFKYVALGDSFSSGEGLDYYLRSHVDPRTGKQVHGDNRCHRASRAYPAFVQPRVYEKPLYAIASGGGDPGRFGGTNKYRSDDNVRSDDDVTWMFHACAGARTFNVWPAKDGGRPQGGGGEYYDPLTQLSHPDLGGADLVTITIGGNDAGFVDVLEACGKPSCAQGAQGDFETVRLRIIRGLRQDLIDTYKAVRNATGSKARILVLGYPHVFPERPKNEGATCRLFDDTEKGILRRLGDEMNDVIASAAKAADVEFVPVAHAFAGHELCTDNSLIHPINLAISGKIDDGSFHPTRDGQRKYADIVNQALERGGP